MAERIDELKNITTLSPDALASQLHTLRYADAVEIINSLDLSEAVAVFVHLPLEYAIELFDKPELQRAGQLISTMPTARAVAILEGMSADETTDVFQEMDDETRKRLFVLLEPATRNELKTLITYPDNSAGALMTTEFLAVPSNWTVGKTLDYIREVERTRETVYTTYVVDPVTSVLLKDVSLRDLVLADPDNMILDAGKVEKPITISPLTDRNDVAQLFRRYDLLSLPVIDNDNHVIGIVTVDDVLDAMAEEMSEDTHKFGGMRSIEKPYMQISFWEMFSKRGGWLAVLFVGELLTASAMQYFEHELEKAIVLTLFIPLIMSSGGNSGSQATSLIIRALALREVSLGDWWRIALRELPTGIALGTTLGMIGLLRVFIWQYAGIYDYGEHWFLIAMTIFLTLVAIVTFGSLTGSLLPFLLKRLGFDPASASAPFVATLVDVSGIVIYFSIAAVILSGTLL